MRLSEILSESIDLPWGHGNAGCWIKPDGEILPCDYEGDRHHGDIAWEYFDLDSDDKDEWAEINDKAFDAGWIRIRMNNNDFTVQLDPKTVNPRTLNLINKVDYEHNRYIADLIGIGHFETDAIGKLLLYIRAKVAK